MDLLKLFIFSDHGDRSFIQRISQTRSSPVADPTLPLMFPGAVCNNGITGKLLHLFRIIKTSNVSYFCDNATYRLYPYPIDLHQSEKLRVLFLSDLHLREYGEHNEELIQTVQELDPDLILLGGDLVTFPNPEYEKMLSLCRSLADVAPLYGVLGNHESEMIYGGVDDQLAEKFSEAGVQLLRNETRTIQIGENNVELIGLEGALKDFYKYGASDCVESLSRQYDTFRICINHVPMAFVDYMQDAPFDLALAGHTHGGLIRLPVLGRLYTAEEGLFPEYAGGMYQLDSGAPLIVGCGLGDSNQIPRVYNPPELVLVDVNWY